MQGVGEADQAITSLFSAEEEVSWGSQLAILFVGSKNSQSSPSFGTNSKQAPRQHPYSRLPELR